MEGHDYIVLGMLTDVKQGAVFCAKELDTAALDRMNIRISDNVTLSFLEQQLQWKLEFTGTALDYRFINNLIELMGFGLCMLLWIYLIHLMTTEFKLFRQKTSPILLSNPANIKRLALRLACISGVIAILSIFLYLHIRIPEDLIPTKWSDFTFWNRLLNDKSERISIWIKCEKRAPELLYLKKLMGAIMNLALSYLFYLVLRAIQFGRNSMRKALEKAQEYQPPIV